MRILKFKLDSSEILFEQLTIDCPALGLHITVTDPDSKLNDLNFIDTLVSSVIADGLVGYDDFEVIIDDGSFRFCDTNTLELQ